ncbi:MAG TPA: hypothetical protein VGU70_19385 [Methylobacterium sp.]|jgi:hypothetical protein|nr:hypothetical protein [Methylobacterium sp.]
MMDRLERYSRNAAHDDECADTENCDASAPNEAAEEATSAPRTAVIPHCDHTMVPDAPAPSRRTDAVPDSVAKPASSTITGKAEAGAQEDEALTALRREVFSLTADMSVEQLTAISDSAVRAAGLLMADLLTLGDGDAAGLTKLAVGVEIPEAGRHGEMAVLLFREALAIRSDAKRKTFEKKRPGRIKALSDFGREGLLDEVARLRGLR